MLSELGMKIAPGGTSRSRGRTYYAARQAPVSAAALEEAYLVNAAVTLWRDNRRVYGVRKLAAAMRRAGFTVGRDQVGRLMRIAGIEGAVRGKHCTTTTTRDEKAPRHPDLVKREWNRPTAPDQLWVADFTYVWTLAGFVYVAFVTDVFSRRILGWRVTTTKSTPLVISVVEQAVTTRRRHDPEFTAEGVIHHSDAGSQYTSLALTEELLTAGITGSIGTVGDALDNALMESAIGLYKTELIKPDAATWRDRRHVEAATAEWIHWYNTARLHTALGYLPPVEYEQHHTPSRQPDVLLTSLA